MTLHVSNKYMHYVTINMYVENDAHKKGLLSIQVSKSGDTSDTIWISRVSTVFHVTANASVVDYTRFCVWRIFNQSTRA